MKPLAELSWPEVQTALESGPFLLLPVGSTEAHGPHLPLSTDVIIARELCARVAPRLEADGHSVLEAPALTYAITNYASEFPGTVSLSAETARALAADVCRSYLETGFEKLVVINGHVEPAHVRVWRDLAKTLPICFPDNTRRKWVATLSEEFQSGDAHAGQYETSLILAARPELVREIMSELEPRALGLVEKMQQGIETFKAMGAEEGYFGDPSAATAEHGHEQYEALVQMVLAEIGERWSA